MVPGEERCGNSPSLLTEARVEGAPGPEPLLGVTRPGLRGLDADGKESWF